MRRAALGIVLMLFAGPAFAETAREMLDASKAVNDAREPKDAYQTVTMRLFDSRGGERVREIEIFALEGEDGESKSLTFFTSPADVKGVGFLSWSHRDKDDDQWLYLPALERVRRITTRSRRQSFQGSDFTYEDLDLLDDLEDWTEEDATSKLLRNGDVIDGAPCAVIELLPIEKDLEYGRMVIWLDRKDSIVRKMEFYRKKDGSLLKTLQLREFKTIGELPTPHQMELANHKKKTRTVMEIAEVQYDQGLEDDAFTKRTLERGKVR